MSLHQYRFSPQQELSPHQSYEFERMQRMANVAQALWFAKSMLPSAVRKETGEALDEALSGILPALLMALVIVDASSLVGASLGALGGGVAGFGVGAVPGAIAGGSLGFSAGMWILEWMGLAFLAMHVGNNMYQVGRLIESGFNEAWGHGPRSRFNTERTPRDWKWQRPTYGGRVYAATIGGRSQLSDIPDFTRVIRASEKFAQAVAILIRMVLEGVVLYLTNEGVAKLPELVAKLRASRLGDGFAVWVETNYQSLMHNPKLKTSAGASGAAAKPVKVLNHAGVPEQPRPKKIEKTRPAPVDTVTTIKNTSVSVEGTSISAQRVLKGTSDNVAVIGRNMKGVEPFAEALGKQGVNVETFNGSKISDEANKEFAELSAFHNGNIPEEALIDTKMYSENKAWVESLVSKGSTIADIGNPFNAGKSVFYEMEKTIIGGGTK